MGVALGAMAGLLYAPAEGAALTALRGRSRPSVDPRIDDEIDQSFPASDPPSWTSATTVSADRDGGLERSRLDYNQ
jgi:gas vesicle protein